MGSLSKLQNGSDVRGVALEVEGGAPVNLTPDIAGRIAAAFVRWLADKRGRDPGKLRIGVGHDSRLTAAALKEGTIRGIAAAGAVPVDCSMASTPAMFCATVYHETAFRSCRTRWP